MSRMDVTRLMLNQQSLCSQSPLTWAFWNDLKSLQTQSSVAARVWLVSETLVPIYNFSCSSFPVPKLAIKWFNWPWNVDCKLWLEKTRDSKVIFFFFFNSNLALTWHAFKKFFQGFLSCSEGCMASCSGKPLLARVLVQPVPMIH